MADDHGRGLRVYLNGTWVFSVTFRNGAVAPELLAVIIAKYRAFERNVWAA